MHLARGKPEMRFRAFIVAVWLVVGANQPYLTWTPRPLVNLDTFLTNPSTAARVPICNLGLHKSFGKVLLPHNHSSTVSKILGNGNKVLQIVNTTTSHTQVCAKFLIVIDYLGVFDLFALFVFAWFWFVWLNLIVVGYHFCFLFQSIPAAVLIGLACLLCCGAGIDLPMFTNGLYVILQQQHCAEAYPSSRNQWKFFPLNHFGER